MLLFPQVSLLRGRKKKTLHCTTLFSLIKLLFYTGVQLWGFPGGLVVKNLPVNAGEAEDMGSIPGRGSPREGGGYPL